MERFILKDIYEEWLSKGKNRITQPNNYIEGVQNLFSSRPSYPAFVREYYNCVPSLIAIGERVLAKQLLACVYADSFLEKKMSYFKKFCAFLADKREQRHFITTDDIQVGIIEEYLRRRQVWITDNELANKLKTIACDNQSTFKNLFYLRIRSWDRPNFPLKVIFDLLDQNYTNKWVGDIYKSILVLSPEETFSLSDIIALDFQRDSEKELFKVFAIVRHGGVCTKHVVLTPLSDESKEPIPMLVKGLEDVSIDHKWPLDSIVKNIYGELGKVVSAVNNYKENALTYLNGTINVKQLRNNLETVKKATSYVLMDRGENSRKSNNSPFSKLIVEGDVIKFIVAENVIDKDGKTYYVYFTNKDETKRLKEL